MSGETYNILSLVLSIVTPVMILIFGGLYASKQKRTDKIEHL